MKANDDRSDWDEGVFFPTKWVAKAPKSLKITREFSATCMDMNPIVSPYDPFR